MTQTAPTATLNDIANAAVADFKIEMTFSTKFIPSIEGVNPNRLIEIDGEKGTFFIGVGGGKPELEHSFFYGDANYQFFFYVDIPHSAKSSIQRDIVIYDASKKALGQGGGFKVDAVDVNEIEANIKKLFETRFIFDLRKKLDAPYCEIRFTWGISK
jgi:hypothetical protein